MKILFIRHASAVSIEDFDGDDLDRPLKKSGIKKAIDLFARYKKIYKEIDLIIASKAKRSCQTAQILSDCFGGVEIRQSELINLEKDYEDFKTLLATLDPAIKTLAIVGHEPNLSLVVSKCVSGGGNVYLKIKKLALVEVEMGLEAKGELVAFVQPRHMKKRSDA